MKLNFTKIITRSHENEKPSMLCWKRVHLLYCLHVLWSSSGYFMTISSKLEGQKVAVAFSPPDKGQLESDKLTLSDPRYKCSAMATKWSQIMKK